MNNLLKKYFKDYRFWAVLGVLILTFFLVYSPHFNYSYPLHVDEWHHISEARSFATGSYNFNSVSSFEMGYHFFLALLIKLGVNLVLFYKFLPAIFAVISSILLFILVIKVTNSYFASLFSIFFFAFLPSNVNLLGLWFAIPFTFAIPFVLACFLFLHQGIKFNDKYLFAFAFCFFALCFVHAISAFFVFIISLVYVLLSINKINNKKLLTLFFIPLILFFVSLFFILLSKKSIWWFFSELVFNDTWTLVNLGIHTNPFIFNFGDLLIFISPYFLPVLLGVMPFFFSLFGIYSNIKMEKINLFVIWLIYSLIMAFSFVNFNISPFVPYQRVVYYSLIVFCIFAGIGLKEVIGYLRSYFNQKKIIGLFFIFVLLFFLAFFSFNNYGKQQTGSELYYLMNSEDYSNLLILDKLISNQLILAPISLSTLIPAVTSNKILANIYFIGGELERKDIELFYLSNCTEKEKIIQRYNLRYVYSDKRINCLSFNELYSGGFFLYLIS